VDKIINLVVDLKCDIKRAYELFTKKNELETWLCVIAEVEMFPGGQYELFWDPQDRENNSTIGCKITALEANQFICFEWKSPKQYKQFANNADPLTHVVIFFQPSELGTVVRLIHTGWRSAAEWEDARSWQEKAWSIAFSGLEQQINK